MSANNDCHLIIIARCSAISEIISLKSYLSVMSLWLTELWLLNINSQPCFARVFFLDIRNIFIVTFRTFFPIKINFRAPEIHSSRSYSKNLMFILCWTQNANENIFLTFTKKWKVINCNEKNICLNIFNLILTT